MLTSPYRLRACSIPPRYPAQPHGQGTESHPAQRQTSSVRRGNTAVIDNSSSEITVANHPNPQQGDGQMECSQGTQETRMSHFE